MKAKGRSCLGPSWECLEVGSWVWDCEWGPSMGWEAGQ